MSEPITLDSHREYICLDCGKLAKHKDLSQFGLFKEMTSIGKCPRCLSENITKYVAAEHEHVVVSVEENFRHPLEDKAQDLFARVLSFTGWREEKGRLWFQLPNPLLGNVSPEWMILTGKVERLEKFIAEAEEANAEYAHESKDHTECEKDHTE